MSRFRKTNKREVPSLNTASLPDLIFTLLFFFMISTRLKDKPPKVEFDLPRVVESEKSLAVSHDIVIFIGKSTKNTDSQFIQINDKLIEISNIPDYIKQNYQQNPELLVTLKADKHTPMGIIDNVKKTLQIAGIQKIRYATVE